MLAFLPGAPRGRHERIKKRSKTAYNNIPNSTTHLIFADPGPRVKMTPRGGLGGPGRGPMTIPRAPRSQSGLGGTWGRSGAQEAPGSLWRYFGSQGGEFWLNFRSFQRLLRSLPGSTRKRKSPAQAQAQSASAGPRAKDNRQQGRKASRTRGTGGMCGAP